LCFAFPGVSLALLAAPQALFVAVGDQAENRISEDSTRYSQLISDFIVGRRWRQRKSANPQNENLPKT
jgi:hypothetical protein